MSNFVCLSRRPTTRPASSSDQVQSFQCQRYYVTCLDGIHTFKQWNTYIYILYKHKIIYYILFLSVLKSTFKKCFYKSIKICDVKKESNISMSLFIILALVYDGMLTAAYSCYWYNGCLSLVQFTHFTKHIISCKFGFFQKLNKKHHEKSLFLGPPL